MLRKAQGKQKKALSGLLWALRGRATGRAYTWHIDKLDEETSWLKRHNKGDK